MPQEKRTDPSPDPSPDNSAEWHERWELASRAAGEGIWDWDLRTNKVYRSSRWFELFGYEPGEVPDTPWAWESMLHPEDAVRVVDLRNRHIAGDADRYYVEHRVRCKDGEYRWYLSRGQVLRDAAGAPVRMLGFYTSIQSRVEERQDLVRRHQELRILYEITLQAIAADSHDETLTAITDRIRVFFAADKVYLNLLDPDGDVMRLHSVSGSVGPTLREFRRGEYFSGLIWQTGTYQCIYRYSDWPGRPDTPDAAQLRSVAGVPLKVANEVVGVIGLGFLKEREIAGEEVNMLRQFAAITALVVRNRQTALRLREEIQQRAALENFLRYNDRIDFLNALADGRAMSRRELEVNADRFGLNAPQGYVAAVAHCQLPADRLDEKIFLPEESTGIHIWRRDEWLLAIHPRLPETYPHQAAISERAEELRQKLEGHLNLKICQIGIGLPCAHLRDLAAGFRQAREALKYGGRLHPNRTIHHFLDVGLLQMMLQQGDRQLIDAFVQERIGKLLDHDHQKNGHLVETLAAIINGRRQQDIADELFIHHKTLLFRKNQIEELTGESLDDPAVRTQLSLALQLHGLNGGR